jgi:hypothetical protein
MHASSLLVSSFTRRYPLLSCVIDSCEIGEAFEIVRMLGAGYWKVGEALQPVG